MTAQFFKPDNFAPEFEKSEVYARLHDVAFRYDVYFKVNRSNITRGWTYNADIYFIEGIGRYYEDEPKTEIKRFRPHGAGNGDNPVSALIHATQLAGLRTPDVLVAILEAEAWLLQRRVRVRRERQEMLDARLTALLDDLTTLVRSVNVPRPADPEEDDDL